MPFPEDSPDKSDSVGDGEAEDSSGGEEIETVLPFDPKNLGRSYEPGERFHIPGWALWLTDDLTAILFTNKELASLSNKEVVGDDGCLALLAKLDLLSAVGLMLLEQGRLKGERSAPRELLDDDCHLLCCERIGRLLALRRYEEVAVFVETLRKLESPLEWFQSLSQKRRMRLQATVTRLDAELDGKTLTKQQLRLSVFGEAVDEGYASRTLRGMGSLRDLPDAKPGPKTK
jgi:hypothetical protein